MAGMSNWHEVILQDDNARPYVLRPVKTYLEEKGKFHWIYMKSKVEIWEKENDLHWIFKPIFWAEKIISFFLGGERMLTFEEGA